MYERGAINVEKAYALGKMLDHSSWQKGSEVLPRGITPGDIDASFDNKGKILFCEFSSSQTQWCDLDIGQLRLYKACVMDSPHCAVLCKHNVTLADNRPIDTRFDVQSFQVMLWDYEFIFTRIWPNDNQDWQRCVMSWFEDPLATRRRFMRKALVE